MNDRLSTTHKAATHDEIEQAFSKRTKIDGRLFLDSAPYTPYKWSVFFIYLGSVVFSLGLLVSNYIFDDIPPSGILHQSLFAGFVGVFLAPPLAIYYLLNLLSPPKLLVDEVGVTLYGFQNKRQVKWNDIEAIVVKNPYEGHYNKSVFFTTIRSKFGSLNWGPYFGIDPNSLVDFLIFQRNLFVSGQKS